MRYTVKLAVHALYYKRVIIISIVEEDQVHKPNILEAR